MKLLEALAIDNKTAIDQADTRTFFLACGFTPLHLLTFLKAHLHSYFPGSKIEIETGIFGDLAGNLRRIPASATGAAVIVEWADLDSRLGIRRLGGWSPKVLPDILSSVSSMLGRLELAIAQISSPVALSLPSLPLPPLAFTAGWQASSFELQLRERLARFAVSVSDRARVRLLNSQRLDRISAPAGRFDAKSDLLTGFPFCQEHTDKLAELLAALLGNAPPKKGLITDLDDTLWKGILGEVGVDGVSWDLAQHSQVHGLYQQFLSALAGRGVLVGVASKNNPALVAQAFERTDLLLPRDHIFPLEVHWSQKSQSVTRILKTWNIAADSVTFVDDSPMELAEVKAAHPGIDCRLFPTSDPAAVLALLDDLRDQFGKSALSEEDQIRRDSLQSSATLERVLEADANTLDDFLRQAGALVTFDFQKHSGDARAFELVNKTNQFNLNGRRYAESDWDCYLQREDTFLGTVSYQDKFGPLGKIAVLLGRRLSPSPCLAIDAWVMSCRAFSRRIEHQCLRRVFEKFQAEELIFDFAETPRNGPLVEFFAGFGSPGPQFRLTKTVFDQACPELSHTVKEI